MSFFARLGSDSDSDSSGSESEESILSGDEGEEQDKRIASKPKTNKASAFLRSDAEDSDEDDSDSDDDDDDDSEGGSDVQRQSMANKFLRDAASSDEDSDEEDKTVVLSAKDKRFVEMESAIQNIKNATKAGGAANDWVLASSELDKLLRFITRHQTSMVSSPIPPAGHIPPQFLGTLVELDSDVATTFAAEKSATKKMPAPKSKALTAMRQTLKKKSKEFELVLETYKSDPEAYAAEYSKANIAPVVPKAPKRPAAEQGQEGDDQQDENFSTVGRGGRVKNFTDRDVLATLKEIAEQRGRKNTDRAETIRTLQKLLEVSTTTYQKIRVLLALIPARLDYSQNLISMPQDSWVSGRQEYDQLVSILLENRGYLVKDIMTEEFDESAELEPANANDRVSIPGSLVGMFENLDNEFTKTLQHIDPHERGVEYVDRLKQEAPLYGTLVKTQTLFEREDASDALVRIVVRRLEHIYAKPDAHIDVLEKAASDNCTGLQSSIVPIGGSSSNSAALIHQLAVHVYGSEAPLFRTRAILMHIYHHSMHARYFKARDLFSKSHMQESIQQADVTTQILYNRALMQFGLAAFRTGDIENCRAHMGDMMSTQRYRELLGQSIQRYNMQLSPEQELLEKRRLLPFHMHVNPELLEAAYLTSCMLVEIPLLASVDSEEQRRKIASKTFKRLLDVAERSAFDGLPENTRDHVIKAARALQIGDWKRSKELLLSAKIWNLFDNGEEIREMLSNKIQIEGLRTYLFTNSAHYVSLSLSHLSEAFSLPVRTITSIVSRMIYKDELQASLDAIDQVIVFKTVEQTEIQRLSLQLADRVNALVEQNERALDQKLNQGQPSDRNKGEAGGGDGNRGERRGGTRGRGGRGRGRGFQGGAMGQRRVAA